MHPMDPVRYLKCRIAIIGSNQLRLVKVTSLLYELLSANLLLLEDKSNRFTTHLVSTQSIDASPSGSIPIIEAVCHNERISIEYLPCLATFDSYTDENGRNVEYLAKVEYHGIDGKSVRGSTLAPFFDDTLFTDHHDVDPKHKRSVKQPMILSGIAGVVLGCGIESTHHVDMLAAFIQSFSLSPVIRTRENGILPSNFSDETPTQQDMDNNQTRFIRRNVHPVVFDHVRCNPEYNSMTQENEAYRRLSDKERQAVLHLGTMGPGKMVHLILDVTRTILDTFWKHHESVHSVQSTDLTTVTDSLSTTIPPPRVIPTFHVQDYARDQIRFACKLCRTYLFSVDDLEDPPHGKSKHDFRNRKNFQGTTHANSCESLFIAASLPWMGDLSDTEGKLACPKCSCKVGQWNWSGAQCSCGSWVTPAIQVPLSRVDKIFPQDMPQSLPENGTMD